MVKNIFKRKLGALIAVIVVLLALVINDAYVKHQRKQQPYFKDSLDPVGESVEIYDINDLTEEEYNKLFYGEDYRDKEN